MPLLIKENNSESPSRSTNDSSAESVNGSLRPEDGSDSPAESVNGSLRPEDSSDSPAESVNGSLRPEDSSDSPTKSANGSLFQQKTLCSLSFMTGSTNGSLSQ